MIWIVCELKFVVRFHLYQQYKDLSYHILFFLFYISAIGLSCYPEQIDQYQHVRSTILLLVKITVIILPSGYSNNKISRCSILLFAFFKEHFFCGHRDDRIMTV